MSTDTYSFEEYYCEYRYEMDALAPGREIVIDILAYFWTDSGKQVAPKELDEAGFIVKDTWDLQQMLDEEWEDDCRETRSDLYSKRY